MRLVLKSILSALATFSLPAWAQPATTVLICKDPKDPTTCLPLTTDIVIIHPDWLVGIATVVLIAAIAAVYAAFKIRSMSSRA